MLNNVSSSSAKWSLALMTMMLLTTMAALQVQTRTPMAPMGPNDSMNVYETRPKMGHLARTNSLTDLYRVYFRLFIEPTMSAKQLAPGKAPLEDDDWRVYSPQNDKCVGFLKGFIILGYKLNNIEDFILLDACLGYLYDEHTFRWTDYSDDDEQGKITINALIRDENLKRIYKGTNLEFINDTNSLACLKSLLMEVMSLRLDDSTTNCNKHWLEQYNNFANCRQVLKQQASGKSKTDSYVDIVSDIVRKLAVSCFLNQMNIMKSEMEKWYQKQLMERLTKGLKATLGVSSEADKQTARLHWPKKLMKVLQVSQGKLSSASTIDFKSVQQMAVKLKNYDSEAQQEFTRNLAQYANKKITINSDNYDDPDGAKRYHDLMMKLCKPFRSQQQQQQLPGNQTGDIRQHTDKSFDFNGTIMQLLTMLIFNDYFGLDEQMFMHEIEDKGDLTMGMYTAHFMCRYMGLTVGRLDNSAVKDSAKLRPDYHVQIAYNADVVMQLWPYSINN